MLPMSPKEFWSSGEDSQGNRKSEDNEISPFMYKVIYYLGQKWGHLIQPAGIQEEILEKVKIKLCLERRDKLTKSKDMWG